MAETASRTLPRVPETPWMQPLPGALRIVLHGDARVRAAAAQPWGVAFPEQACRAAVGQGRATLWMGPDEYLLISAEPDKGEAILAELEGAIGELPHALVDVSHRQFAFELRGPRAALILNAVCPLDLDPEAFPVDMCTRTMLAKADIVLWRTEPDVFQIEIWRSYEGYVGGLLSEIAGEFQD